MVFTLHRYIFRELLKVFVLAAIALTLMLSLGSILRPVQEYGAGPRQVVHLMVYFLPITLTFVLPMAALFASALVYGRVASDNEIDACKASGINVPTLVYPGLALALAVATANLVLSFHVMPYFVHLAERSLKADAKQMLFRNIQRNGYYKVPPDERYLIYADGASLKDDTLEGVVVTEVKNNEIAEIITTEHAKVDFVSNERFNEVHITARNTYRMDSRGNLFLGELSFGAEFGSLLGDDVKFKKVGEMKRIKRDLMRFYPIAKLARETCAQYGAELLAEEVRRKISAGDSCSLYSGEKLVAFTASNCLANKDREVELTGEVVVVESDASGEGATERLTCSKAFLRIEGDEFSPTLTMDIYNAQVEGSGDLRMRHIIRGLIPPAAVSAKFGTGDILKDISKEAMSSGLAQGASARLRALREELNRKIRKTLAQIKAEIHSRLVFGLGCIPMILIGIGLGIIKKGGHLLSAFGASCVPAAVLVICIMSGKNIAENLGAQSISGVMLMWGGLVFLCVLAFGIHLKLARN